MSAPPENPWLAIPLCDYEAHMALVGQARMLPDAFADALERHRPASVALLGCAGGNGPEHAVGEPGLRVVPVDVNPAYAGRTRERFEARIPGLAILAADDPDAILIPDPDHSTVENRFILIGSATTGRLLVVVHTHRDAAATICLISARPASRRERRQYSEILR